MRIISGIYKGKTIKGHNIEGTRPTMDRVKESLFSMIQLKIKNSVCLDLFSGSGNLGIECISNGSKITYFVDNNIQAIKTLKENLNNVYEDYIILNKDYMEALNYFINNNIKFDIILLDPPYKLNYINNILNIVYENKLLNENGIVVCEYENENIENNNLELIKEKKYGSKHIKIYRFDKK
ncbi:MAG: 16S rRNA (guanine(966)-N(2))-methyltransferase RsmD [Bacilli bacterium]|nr:16S rRNA (guanine(966)-N(2))-methyltransferase RsmD [Bacilli bacterium]